MQSLMHRHTYVYVFFLCFLIVATIVVGAKNAQAAASFTSCGASPTTVYNGDYSTITWSTTGATSCTINNVGSVGTSGQVTVGPFPYGNGANDFSINCSGVGGSAYCPIGISMSCGNGIVEAGEACDLGANNGNYCPNTCSITCQPIYCSNAQIPVVTASFSPNPVLVGTNTTLSWNGNNNSGVSCVVRDPLSQEYGGAQQPVVGSMSIGPFNTLGDQTWSVDCYSPWSNTYSNTGHAFPTISVRRGNEAQCMSVSGVPSTVQAGTPFTATVVMKNVGINAWTTDGTPHNLGSQSPQDNVNWGVNRVALPSSPINPGSNATFTFTVTPAWTLSGNQTFAWRMVEDGVEWFLAPTDSTNQDRQCSVTIPVTPPPAPVVTLQGKSSWDTTPISAPGNVSLSYGYGSASDSYLALNWSATNGATACRLKKSDGTLVASFGAPPSSYASIPALYANQGYFVECDGPGGTGTSGTLNFMIPPVPTGLSASVNVNGTQTTLNWTLPANANCAHNDCSHTYVRMYKASYSDLANDWGAACTSGPPGYNPPAKTPPEGVCTDWILANPYAITTTPNTKYWWYVQTEDNKGAWSQQMSGGSFTTTPNVPVVTTSCNSSHSSGTLTSTAGASASCISAYGYTGTVSWTATNGATLCRLYNNNGPINGNADFPPSGSYTTPALTTTDTYFVRCQNAAGWDTQGNGNQNSVSFVVPPPPTLGSPAHICSPDGTSMTLKFTMPASYPYTTNYLRGYDTSQAWTCGAGQLCLNGSGNDYTWTGLTPGAKYSWWVHTRDPNTAAWSMQVGEGRGITGNPADDISCNGQPNLTAGATGVVPSSPTTNQTTTFSATVSNTGTGASASSTPTVFQVANNALTVTYTRVAATTSVMLGAGASAAVSGSYSTTTVGTYQVRACANTNTSGSMSGTESNYGDNCGAWTPVTVTLAANPNLTAGAPSPLFATVGSANTLSSTITNSGTADVAGTFSNVFQFASAADGTGAGTPVAGSSITGLTTATPKTTTYSWTPASAGTYYVRACADNNTSWVGSITESNEGDNCSGAPYTSILACNGGCNAGPPNPTCNNGATNPPSCNTFTPTATLNVNNGYTATINDGQSANLTWISSNATSCAGTGFDAGGATNNLVGVSTGPLASAGSPYNYSLTCSSGALNSAPSIATVTVISPNVTITAAPPRVSLTPPNNATTITWTSSPEVTTCSVKGPWGTQISTALNGSYATTTDSNTKRPITFSITCQTSGSPVFATTTVNTSVNPIEF